MAELKLVSETAAVADGASGTLLELVGAGGVAPRAGRRRRPAAGRGAERRRPSTPGGPGCNRCRHLRWHQRPEGGIAGAFFCDEVAWARIAPRLEGEARRRWKAAGGREPLEAHRLDAFLELLAGGAGSAGAVRAVRSAGGARPHTVVIVDAGALRRGTVDDGELCEIEGIGPVSVEAATELLGEGGLQFAGPRRHRHQDGDRHHAEPAPADGRRAGGPGPHLLPSKGAANGTASKSTTAGSTSPPAGRPASTIWPACAPSTTISRPTAAGGWKAGPGVGDGSPPPIRRAPATSPGPGGWRRRKANRTYLARPENGISWAPTGCGVKNFCHRPGGFKT